VENQGLLRSFRTKTSKIQSGYLSVGFDHGLAMTRVDLVPAVGAQSDPLNKNKKQTTNIKTYKSSTVRIVRRSVLFGSDERTSVIVERRKFTVNKRREDKPKAFIDMNNSLIDVKTGLKWMKLTSF